MNTPNDSGGGSNTIRPKSPPKSPESETESLLAKINGQYLYKLILVKEDQLRVLYPDYKWYSAVMKKPTKIAGLKFAFFCSHGFNKDIGAIDLHLIQWDGHKGHTCVHKNCPDRYKSKHMMFVCECGLIGRSKDRKSHEYQCPRRGLNSKKRDRESIQESQEMISREEKQPDKTLDNEYQQEKSLDLVLKTLDQETKRRKPPDKEDHDIGQYFKED